MPARKDDGDTEELVIKAIAEAELGGKVTDAEFLERLRTIWFTRNPAVRRQLPTVQGARPRAIDTTRTAAKGDGVAADPSQRIFADPRFQKNARALAERTAKRQRVIGGSRVLGSDFADCVAVGSDEEFGCTGTLVASNVVISAGHCAHLATRVFFGNDIAGKGVIVGVKRAVRHPEYHRAKNNDLLVLILDKKVKVPPRALASSALIQKATDGRVVGFGHSDAGGSRGYGIKRQVDVPIASVACRGRVSGESDAMAYGCDRGVELVAGKSLLAKDSCSGDSGGPFYIRDSRGDWLLAGATSRATKSAMATCGDGGIYARVDQYREWIEEEGKVRLVVGGDEAGP